MQDGCRALSIDSQSPFVIRKGELNGIRNQTVNLSD